MISQDGCAIIVDPGDAEPVIDALKQYNLKLECILVTHHHSDHIGGIQSLVQKTGAQVIAPNHPNIPKPYQVPDASVSSWFASVPHLHFSNISQRI